MISHKDLLSVSFRDMKNALPCFPTKRAACEAGKQYGWVNTAIRCHYRFEDFWIVGKKMLGEDEVAGVKRDHYRLPLLKWEENHGAKYCPVLTVYVAKRNQQYMVHK